MQFNDIELRSANEKKLALWFVVKCWRVVCQHSRNSGNQTYGHILLIPDYFDDVEVDAGDAIGMNLLISTLHLRRYDAYSSFDEVKIHYAINHESVDEILKKIRLTKQQVFPMIYGNSKISPFYKIVEIHSNIELKETANPDVLCCKY